MKTHLRRIFGQIGLFLAALFAGLQFLNFIFTAPKIPRDAVDFLNWILQTPWQVSTFIAICLFLFPFWAFWPDRQAAQERKITEIKFRDEIADTLLKMRQSNDRAWEIAHELSLLREETERHSKKVESEVSRFENLMKELSNNFTERYNEIEQNFVYRTNWTDDIYQIEKQIKNLRSDAKEWARLENIDLRRELREYITD